MDSENRKTDFVEKRHCDRRSFLKTIGFGAAAAVVGGCGENGISLFGKKEKKKPNIIFIMTDDQGPWAFGAAPNPNARTPHIDRLRGQSARLINYFVTTPVCSPSRAGLMTSRYSTEVGIPDYISGNDPELGLDPHLPTWPRALAEAGYATALFGKWHLGKHDRHYPTRYGYAEFAGFRVGGSISQNPNVEIDGKVRKVQGYTPDILTDLAIDFLHRRWNIPFQMSLHFWAPHANTANRSPDGDRTWLPVSDADWNQFKNMDPKFPEPDYPNLDTPRLTRMTREYFASVAAVDRNVGRLLRILDELKLSENTIVVFTSDNGFNMGHRGIWHKGNGRWILTDNRGHRPNMYDNSMRVPAIVRWPGKIKPGITIDQTVTNLDWFPTILAMADVPLTTDAVIRGRNFLPLLKGKKIEWDNDLFAQYRMWKWNQTGADLRTYRTPRWKLVRDFKHEGKDELYNLARDPDEKNNLIDSQNANVRSIRQYLNGKLLEKMKQVHDPALSANGGA